MQTELIGAIIKWQGENFKVLESEIVDLVQVEGMLRTLHKLKICRLRKDGVIRKRKGNKLEVTAFAHTLEIVQEAPRQYAKPDTQGWEYLEGYRKAIQDMMELINKLKV